MLRERGEAVEEVAVCGGADRGREVCGAGLAVFAGVDGIAERRRAPRFWCRSDRGPAVLAELGVDRGGGREVEGFPFDQVLPTVLAGRARQGGEREVVQGAVGEDEEAVAGFDAVGDGLEESFVEPPGSAIAGFGGLVVVDLLIEVQNLEPQLDSLDVDVSDFQIAFFGEEKDIEPFFGDGVGDKKRFRIEGLPDLLQGQRLRRLPVVAAGGAADLGVDHVALAAELDLLLDELADRFLVGLGNGAQAVDLAVDGVVAGGDRLALRFELGWNFR